ncbi:hypothetical protein [Actinocrinis sp.]|uniref:hypothetical protein n=1 Tax=Actinocrinis sp. TaxID=1920516 RepID=UPI002D2777A6|nr:hypothetical protein [Actinocrinis sp.]HZP52574.1 hypothetical protein [Actinocrinis sp.]
MIAGSQDGRGAAIGLTPRRRSVPLLWLADAFSPATAVAIGGAACTVLAVWVQGTKALHVLDEDRTKAT